MSTTLVCCALLLLSGCAVGSEPLHAFYNYQAMKFANVVQQRQDFSCGAAAVATLLTWGLRKQTSEEEILAWAGGRWDVTRISQRGFSLLQLAEYVRAQDIQAVGARVDYDVLKSLPEPVIVHLDVLGFAHFAVLRGIQGDRVYLADSSFGNISMPVQGFLRMWLRVADPEAEGEAAAQGERTGTILAVGNEGGQSDRLRIKSNEDISRLTDIEDFTMRHVATREGSRLVQL